MQFGEGDRLKWHTQRQQKIGVSYVCTVRPRYPAAGLRVKLITVGTRTADVRYTKHTIA